MEDERLKILRMLEEGKISAADAARLIDALPGDDKREKPQGKKIRITVVDPKTNKRKVNLTIPLGLARFAAKFIPAKKKEELVAEGIDVDDLLSQITTENIGKIVDVESDEGNVEISIE